MSLADLNYERIGFWGLFTVYMLRDIIAPTLRTYFPHVLKNQSREQDREDKRLDFQQQMTLRSTEALEGISKALPVLSDRLGDVEKGISEIKERLPKKRTAKR